MDPYDWKRTSRARVWQKEWERVPWDFTRRTVQTETVEPTHRAQTSRVENKRNARMEKYKEYQVFYYGSERERAVRKSQLRQQLKEQVDKMENPRHVFASSFEESKKLAEEDCQKTKQEKEMHWKKREFLTKFRDHNKMLIEEHAAQRKAEREAELAVEKRRLESTPHNWSHSLW